MTAQNPQTAPKMPKDQATQFIIGLINDFVATLPQTARPGTAAMAQAAMDSLTDGGMPPMVQNEGAPTPPGAG